MPSDKSLRASSCRSRARLSDTSGYFPYDISFSLLSNRYFHRQSFPPLGVTTRNRPRPSRRSYGLSAWVARLICRSVSAIENLISQKYPQGSEKYPQKYPLRSVAFIARLWTDAEGNPRGYWLLRY